MEVSNDENRPVYGGYDDSVSDSESQFSKMSKWKRNLFYFVIGLGGLFTILIMRKLSEKQSEKKKLREKVRYFKPTITETALSKSISWEMRDTPLTDEQLDAFMQSEKLM